MRYLAASLAVAVALSTTATADMIPVLDHGFEVVVLSPGEFTIGNIPSWDISGSASTFRPTAAQFPGGVPEGVNVAAVNGNSSISQVVSAVLQANTTYTLQVDVGSRLDFPLGGYSIALIAGGVTLASDSSLNPAAGAFLTDTLTFSAGPNPAQLGSNLQIQLSAFGGGQAIFDNVRLDAVGQAAVPEPASLVLLAVGALGVLVHGRRRRRSVAP